MLASWTLENFKSVGPRITLSLSPITVLVGANSSGKSSIIQSILLIKQTLQYAAEERAIALNGPLLRLGNFLDVKHSNSDDSSFSIGWTHDFRHVTFVSNSRATRRLERYPITRYLSEARIDCAVKFDSGLDTLKSELALLQPSLVSCGLSITTYDGEERKSHLEIERTDTEADIGDVVTSRALPEVARHSQRMKYIIAAMDPETRSEVLEDHPNGFLTGAVTRNFWPAYIAVRFDEAQRKANELAEEVCSLRMSSKFRYEYADEPVPVAVKAIVKEWLNANSEYFAHQESLFDLPRLDDVETASDLIEMLSVLRRRSRSSSSTSFPSLQELQPRLIEAFAATFPSQILVEPERPRLISAATAEMRAYFDSSVRYLGPLRDEPKPLYPLEALAEPTDVGYRGEHTAAVLDLNKYRLIQYVPTRNFVNSTAASYVEINQTNATLETAVVDWLSYMGVVEAISTGDRGKNGHELQVQTPGLSRLHDLTNVGVGVSQVLPIVVMALLAQPGSLLIFEQPELHLHPRVQARLADFFLSIALSQKQCLVESHSEYLIHRLRRRIAEATGDDLAHISRLYFVERDAGVTSCRSVDISRFGAIVDWPTDFFDQAQLESESILAAAGAKRAAERNSQRK